MKYRRTFWPAAIFFLIPLSIVFGGEKQINRAFWEETAGVSPDEILSAESESDPRFIDSAAKMLDRLGRSVPDLFLAAGASDEAKKFFENPEENFGRVLRFRGTVERLEETVFAGRNLFRLFVRDDSLPAPLCVYALTIPESWKNLDGKNPPEREKCLGEGVCFWRSADGATLLAKRVGYTDADSFPGSLGIDLSVFEEIEARSVASLEKISDPEKKRAAVQNFRLTRNDIRPFYELLTAAASGAGEKIAREARTEKQNGTALSTVDLFNRPENSQGRAMEATGTIRRARRIPIADETVRAWTGLDHYYELYLFTNDSQGYPLVFCVPELPDEINSGGSPAGAEGIGGDFHRTGTAAGIFYKPWAYSIARRGSDGTDGAEASEPNLADSGAWIAVPLLIGRIERLDPAEETELNGGMPTSVQAILSVFFLLALLALIYLTLRPKRPPIEFRLGREP